MLTGFLYFFYFSSCATASFAQDWQKLSGDHFLVYFSQDESFAKEISYRAESYYVRIASDLGYPRYSEFWTWDKRVKIYIYPDRASYLEASNQPAWSQGMANYTNKQILSYAHSQEFVNDILPHEIAHLIFRDFVGFKGGVPLWLDEGVAQWAEPRKREIVKAVSKDLLAGSSLFSVADMVNLDIRRVAEGDTIQIHSIRDKEGKRKLLSLNGDIVVRTYYIEAVSLVEFLINRFGGTAFTDFCRQLRDGKRLEEALRLAYSTRINSIEELEKLWLEYLA
jgi:hypothetical protein